MHGRVEHDLAGQNVQNHGIGYEDGARRRAVGEAVQRAEQAQRVVPCQQQALQIEAHARRRRGVDEAHVHGRVLLR